MYRILFLLFVFVVMSGVSYAQLQLDPYPLKKTEDKNAAFSPSPEILQQLLADKAARDARAVKEAAQTEVQIKAPIEEHDPVQEHIHAVETITKTKIDEEIEQSEKTDMSKAHEFIDNVPPAQTAAKKAFESTKKVVASKEKAVSEIAPELVEVKEVDIPKELTIEAGPVPKRVNHAIDLDHVTVIVKDKGDKAFDPAGIVKFSDDVPKVADQYRDDVALTTDMVVHNGDQYQGAVNEVKTLDSEALDSFTPAQIQEQALSRGVQSRDEHVVVTRIVDELDEAVKPKPVSVDPQVVPQPMEVKQDKAAIEEFLEKEDVSIAEAPIIKTLESRDFAQEQGLGSLVVRDNIRVYFDEKNVQESWGKEHVQSVSTEAVTADKSVFEGWNAKAGDDVFQTLKAWTAVANVSLVWDSVFYPDILNDVHFTGAFEEAVSELLTDYEEMQAGVVATLYIDPKTGIKTLVVQSKDRLG